MDCGDVLFERFKKHIVVKKEEIQVNKPILIYFFTYLFGH